MDQAQKNMGFTIGALWLALLAYFCIIFLPSLYSAEISSDVAIVLSFAGRMLEGMSPMEGYYDPNPPLSFLVYVPVAWAAKVTGLAAYQAHFFYTLLWVALSFGFSLHFLKKLIAERGVFHIIALIGLAALMIVPGIGFGDRDHLIILGMLPLLFVQLCYLKNIPVTQKLSFPVLAFGVFAVLIKPHYGLLPVFLLGLRLWKTRKIKSVFRADFFFLAAGTLIYALILALFFHDYALIIFPDVINLYASVRHPIVWPESAGYTILFALCLYAGYESRARKDNKNILGMICALGWLLLVVFVAQGKGLNYHRIPFLVFFFPAFALSLYFLGRLKLRENICLALSVVITFFGITSVRGLPSQFLTHQDFKELPLSVALEEHCPAPCSYFFFHDTSELIHSLALYHGAFHASRFTSLWFLPVILKREHEGDPEGAALKKKYTEMMSDDFKKFEPKTLIIMTGEGNAGIDYHFMEYFSSDPEFADIMRAYEKVDEITFARSIYSPGMISGFNSEPPVTFTIFRHK